MFQEIGTPWRLIRGEVGALKIAGQVAALVAKWHLVPGDVPGSWVFTAHAHYVNNFLMTQGPDVLMLQADKKMFRWRGVRLELGGDQVLRGTLIGAPEVR